MSKVVLIALAVTLLIGLSAAAHAMDTNWALMLRATDSSGESTGSFLVATKTGASDQYSPNEDYSWDNPPWFGVNGTPAEISSTIVPRATGDVRAPLTTPGQVKIWDLIMFHNGGVATTITLTGWVAAGTNGQINGSGGTVLLRDRITHEVFWTVPHDVSGSQSSPQFTRTFVANTNQTFELQLVAINDPVPEPASLLAVLTGLAGLTGFTIRRRK